MKTNVCSDTAAANLFNHGVKLSRPGRASSRRLVCWTDSRICPAARLPFDLNCAAGIATNDVPTRSIRAALPKAAGSLALGAARQTI
jgi:hypothetical protein